MRYFDMHCDTLSRCVDEHKNIYDNDFQINLKRLNEIDKAVQFFAAYTNTFKYGGEAAFERFESQFDVFKTVSQYDCANVTPILTVESLSCINGDIDKIGYLKECGVKVASLNWNGYNGIAGGIGSEEGISEFGRDVVKELENCNIVIDVSHLNDRSFFELEKIAKKPFIATHSNAREYCGEPRNLTNDQLKIIFERGGIVGLNLYNKFLGERKNGYDDLMAHIEIMENCGGRAQISLGTDFDGCDTEERFNNVSDMPNFHSYIAEKASTEYADGVFYDNAASFFADLF